MSLILDALNRADQERKEENHIPSLQTVHGSGEPDKPSLRQRLHLERWLILLVVAYLAYDFSRDSEKEAVVQEPALAHAQNTSDAPQSIAEAAQAAESTALAAKVVEPLAVPEEPVVETAPAQPQSGQQRRTPAPAVESLYTEPRPVPPQPGTTPSNAGDTVPQAPEPVQDTPQVPQTGRELAFNLVLEVTDLDKEFRRQIPTLKYSNHQPANNPVDSRVVLNKTVYKEGDQVAPGLVLRQISPEGIVLEFQGTKFKLPAYNSWINFPGS